MRSMRLPTSITAALIGSLAVASSASAAQLQANGRGNAVYRASGEATTWSLRVGRGKIFLKSDDPKAKLELVCVVPRRRLPCYRTAIGQPGEIGYRILRPVKFVYTGTDYRLRLFRVLRFNLNVLGAGRALLRGEGTYTLDGETATYTEDDGRVLLTLEPSELQTPAPTLAALPIR